MVDVIKFPFIFCLAIVYGYEGDPRLDRVDDIAEEERGSPHGRRGNTPAPTFPPGYNDSYCADQTEPTGAKDTDGPYWNLPNWNMTHQLKKLGCCCECALDCAMWADPHISSFDNREGEQGPDYLSLASNQGNNHVKTYYHTYFESFDKYQSKVQRRWPFKKETSTTLAPSENMSDNIQDRTLDANAYETGDFWLVKSEPVYIQGRFRLAQEFLPDNAAIGAVAVGGPFLGGHVFIIEPLDGDATLDGAPMPSGSFSQTSEAGNETMNMTMDMFPGNAVEKVQPYADFNAALPMGVSMKIRRWLRHLDVKISMAKDIPGGVDGECGNGNMNPYDDSPEGIQSRMGDVNVNESQKLFMKKFPVWIGTGKDGFDAVQATGDAHMMGKFIRLLLAERGAQLMSESKLSGIIAYYTGEEERNSFSDLIGELQEADWVKGFNSGSSWGFGRIFDKVFRSFGLNNSETDTAV